MLKQLRPALAMVVAMTVLTGLIYPFTVTGIAQIAFPRQANGSLIERAGTVVGSALIGQAFSDAKYFHGRPSATTDADPDDAAKTVPAHYNAAGSAGSNLGPTSQALVDRVKQQVGALALPPGTTAPADMATASASGLDPHVSPAAAALQVPRVAKARNLSIAAVEQLVAATTTGRTFGLLGEPHVNVLALNLALDALGAR